MRLKSELYPDEQKDILNKIINILDLDDESSITLYGLDNDEDKKQKIMDLLPQIIKYFTHRNVVGVANPEKCKRPYLSIIKFVSKDSYNIFNSSCRIKANDKFVKTIKYTFMLKPT